MRTTGLLSILGALLAACSSTLTSGPITPPVRYNTDVEYVEVRSLISATENAIIPLGPGRSYWYDSTNGSRWASESATVPASTKVLIWQGGMGHVDPARRELTLRHVEGPREVKQGWYGRITEIQPGTGQALQVTLEDGRRFEVTGGDREDLPRLPFPVLVAQEQDKIFVLRDQDELTVVRVLTQAP